MGFAENLRLFGDPAASSTGYLEPMEDEAPAFALTLEDTAQNAALRGLVVPLARRLSYALQYARQMEERASVCRCRQCVGMYVQAQLHVLNLAHSNGVPKDKLLALQQKKRSLMR